MSTAEEKDKKQKAGLKVVEALNNMRQSLIDQGVDMEKLHKEMLEELEIMRAERSTKH